MEIKAFRLVLAIILVTSQLGICVFDLINRDWKTGVIAFLFGVANILIFFVK